MKKQLKISSHPQGTAEWKHDRIGMVTASCFDDAIAKKGSAKRATYMNTLIAELLTGEAEDLKAAALEWGKANEHLARTAYELITGHKVDEAGFIFSDNGRMGCSADGLIHDLNKGLELKNPFATNNHVAFLLADKIKPEYIYQVQAGLWITGADTWDFGSHDPRVRSGKIKFVTLEPDLKLFERFENEIGEFLLDMDAELAKLGYTFDQLKE